jgi:hypothetical protein
MMIDEVGPPMEITSEAIRLFHRAPMIQADYAGLDHCADLLMNGYIGQERYRKMVAAAQDNPEARKRWMRDGHLRRPLRRRCGRGHAARAGLHQLRGAGAWLGSARPQWSINMR